MERKDAHVPYLYSIKFVLFQQALTHGHSLSVRLLTSHNLSPQLLVLKQLQITGSNISNGLLCLHPTQHLRAPQGVVLCLEAKYQRLPTIKLLQSTSN